MIRVSVDTVYERVVVIHFQYLFRLYLPLHYFAILGQGRL